MIKVKNCNISPKYNSITRVLIKSLFKLRAVNVCAVQTGNNERSMHNHGALITTNRRPSQMTLTLRHNHNTTCRTYEAALMNPLVALTSRLLKGCLIARGLLNLFYQYFLRCAL
jgi:hypothetical protein